MVLCGCAVLSSHAVSLTNLRIPFTRKKLKIHLLLPRSHGPRAASKEKERILISHHKSLFIFSVACCFLFVFLVCLLSESLSKGSHRYFCADPIAMT